MTESAIEKHEREIKAFIKELEENKAMLLITRNSYIETIPLFLENQYEIIMNAAIERQPGLLRELKTDDIRKLKEKLKKLKERAKDIAQKYVNIDAVWEVDNKNGSANQYSAIVDISGKLHNAICMAIGEIAPLLIKHRFVNPDKNTEWNRNSDDTFTYRHAINLPSQSLRNKYESILSSRYSLINRLEAAKDGKKIAEAKEIWDKA